MAKEYDALSEGEIRSDDDNDDESMNCRTDDHKLHSVTSRSAASNHSQPPLTQSDYLLNKNKSKSTREINGYASRANSALNSYAEPSSAGGSGHCGSRHMRDSKHLHGDEFPLGQGRFDHFSQLPVDLRQRLGSKKDSCQRRSPDHLNPPSRDLRQLMRSNENNPKRRLVEFKGNDSKRQKTAHYEKHPQNRRSSQQTVMMYRKQYVRQPSAKHVYRPDRCSPTRRIVDSHKVIPRTTGRRSLPIEHSRSHKYFPVRDRPIRQSEKSMGDATSAKRNKTSAIEVQLPKSKFCQTGGMLRALLQNDRQEILEELLRQLHEFRQYCEDEHLNDTLKDDALAVLAKVCDENDDNVGHSSSNTKKLNTLLLMIQETYFLKSLHRYIRKIPQRDVRQSQYSMNDLVRFCVAFTKTMVTKFQGSLDRLLIVLHAIQDIMKLIEEKIEQDVVINVNDLEALINRIKRMVKPRYVENSDDDNDNEDIDVATVAKDSGERRIGSFRNITVYPTTHELTRTKHPYLERNKIGERYKSVEHYLSVQFRLLREDMLRPLCETITSYIQSHQCRHPRDRDIWVYKEATFNKMSASEFGIAHTIKFTSTNRSWRKRLKFGTIVCMSADDFQTILVAVVVNRDLVERGFVDLQFLSKTNDLGTIYQRQYIMLESSSVFFESYRYVLKALQSFTNDNFPFKRYIIEAKVNVNAPKYLRDAKNTSYDLTSLMKSPKKNIHRVNIMEPDTWPTIEETDLDESQYEAMRNALAKEVAVIQGPPGTGKTFIGLKLMEVLLVNRHVWCESEHGMGPPILVVCYTNHALDEFCEGVVQMNKLTTDEFVRLGSRSKNMTISRYSLRNQRIERRIGCPRRERLKPFDDIVHILNDLTEGILDIDTLLYFECLTKYQEHKLRGETECRQLKSLHKWLCVEEYDKCLVFGGWGCSREPNDNFSLRTSLLEQTIDSLQENGDRKRLKRVRDLYRRLLERLENLVPCSELAKCDPWDLDLDNRWNLYAHWVEQVRRSLCEEYRNKVEQNEIQCGNDDFQILSGKQVIAATTSAVSKNAALLRRLKPKIVIVEEAARILEAHVLSSVTGDCDHLIMIGDHQQLRPETAAYDLRKRYHLDVSLFERLILNGLGYDQLKYQHRMSPNISNIVRSVFYKKLKDTMSVKDKISMEGVATNLMLIDHQNNESCDGESRSRSNQHEAKFIIAFSVFLVQQGYKAGKITMLTPYLGQSDLLRKLSKCEPLLEDAKIKVLDDYQGEENDIIMLSLVRSNEERKIGFLKDEKRICVMLSRAKKAMYCIGNFQMLEGQSATWKRVVALAKSGNNFGTYVKVMCKKHPEFSVKVESNKDFKQLPDGGCPTPCDHRLDCGHVCPRACHPYDEKHREVICPKECDETIKSCDRNHTCDKKCGEPCRTRCVQEVQVKLLCGHLKKLKCYENPHDATCRYICSRKLPCGHDCKQKCYETCDAKQCKVVVKKTDWSCGHVVMVSCSTSQTSCPQPCEVTLKCGHVCKGRCGECMNGRIHVPCSEKCLRTLVCGHACTSNCCLACPPCKKDCENRCFHSCCKKKCGDRCVPCKEKCQWSCKHATCTQTCGKPCDRQRCEEACMMKLPCKHPCIGLCGEPCPKKCRICNKEEVQEIFFGTEDEESARFIELEECGHILETESMDRWMEIVDENKDTGITVQMKGCPRCKTTIRKSLRYGDVIKSRLNDVESVQVKIMGGKERHSALLDFRERYNNGIIGLRHDNIYSLVQVPDWFQKHINRRRINTILANDVSLQEIIDLRNKLEFILQLNIITNKPLLRSVEKRGNIISRRRIVEDVLQKYKDSILTEQQLYDISIQLSWMQAEINYLELKGTPNSEADLATIKRILDQRLLFPGDFDELKSLFDDIRKRSGLGITDDEKIMIVKAMGLAKGHWYKCPNNHVYAIGECGGANQESACPECKETIGGTKHRLSQGNAVASEMDGARHAAWSEAANLENYDPIALI